VTKPSTKAYAEAIQGGELVQFTADFVSPNARGERCRLSVKAYDYFEGQPKALYVQLHAGADDLTSRAGMWVFDRSQLAAAIVKMGDHAAIPTDRWIDIATLVVEGNHDLPDAAARALVLAMLGELFTLE
jgi:hypothetical protein